MRTEPFTEGEAYLVALGNQSKLEVVTSLGTSSLTLGGVMGFSPCRRAA